VNKTGQDAAGRRAQPPTEAVDDSPTAVHSEQGRLSAVPPFDFAQSLAFIAGFSPAAGEQRVTATALTKALVVGDETVAYALTADAGTPGVRYTLYTQRPPAAQLRQAVLEQIAGFLSLDDNLAPFYAIGEADPVFAPVIRRLHGMHHVKFPTLAECACWFVLSQHIQMGIARAMKNRLVERYGGSISLHGTTYRAFPTFARLAEAGPTELATVIGNERRAASLRNVVAALSDADEQFLRTAPYEEAAGWLRRINGVGEWTASAILLRGLGRTEQLPPAVRPILSAMTKLYGPDATMAQIAERYGGWIGYWSLYLRAAA